MRGSPQKQGSPASLDPTYYVTASRLMPGAEGYLSRNAPSPIAGPRGKSIFSAGFRELTDTRLGKEESAAADRML
jgi:hypothetical protein